MIKEAMLYERLDGGKVHCHLCSHQCKIPSGGFGICRVRENKNGKLHTNVYGEIIAAHADPIEKKPLYHFLPGSDSYSIATRGCNFKCSFCQNWEISQFRLRQGFGGQARFEAEGADVAPEEVVKDAKRYGCNSISYTYTEPTIFFEYAHDTAKLAKDAGLYNVFVTNGYMTKEALETIRPYLDACNVDIKGFSEDFYAKFCNARLGPVLDSVRAMKKLDIWVEITTLVVPGQNDSDKDLRGIAEFIASIGVEIPWHISRFHPDYEYLNSQSTPIETLKKAKNIGEEAGLRYVYLGNVSEGNNTYCHNCKSLLVERRIFDIISYNIKGNKCSKCGTNIEGRFT